MISAAPKILQTYSEGSQHLDIFWRLKKIDIKDNDSEIKWRLQSTIEAK